MRVSSGVRAVAASFSTVIFHVIARECDEFTVYSAGTVVVTESLRRARRCEVQGGQSHAAAVARLE